MPLSWNEIRSRAIAFGKDWSTERSERAEAQSFWNGFFEVFGIERRRVASFEKQVQIAREGRKLKAGRIDGFWKGVLLIEHKSAGESLDRAFSQAVDYFDGLIERDIPRYVVVSDFARVRLTDFETGEETEFAVADLHQHIRRFGFIAGYQTQTIRPQDRVNIEAAEQMGRLHDALKASGYDGHPLEVFLVRLLFCLFADDTGIFQPTQAFRSWVEERTAVDGSDLGAQLAQLFQVLNTDKVRRSKALDEQLASFEYINGSLFAEALPLASFDRTMRDLLLDACAIDWSGISPAIFGALFQSIMDAKARRNLGAHYTSEENILKLIKPLFLDDLRSEFDRVRGNRNRLFDFHKKLRRLTFLDPACGCGNFLVITYRELRLLELDVLRAVHSSGQRFVDIHQELAVDVDQFHGIEIEEFPVQIAQVALWLIDHQMNLKVSAEFGLYFARIPLKATPHIVHANALRLEWNDVLPAETCSFVLGNPPFLGKKEQSSEQKADFAPVMQVIPGSGVLDFVTAWYVKATRYIARNPRLQAALVSTNSITQGEQVAALWPWLLAQGIRIRFAHRTFRWSNEAKGRAAVHCVIIGFGQADPVSRTVFDYDAADGRPHANAVANINPYLVDAADVVLASRASPICTVPVISYGSFALDDGNFTISGDERDELLRADPSAEKFLREFLGGEELINGIKRWCLWLIDASPGELRRSPAILQRVANVREWRAGRDRETTRRLAQTPTHFAEVRQPKGPYIAIPTVSSERRAFIPIAFLNSTVIASNQLYVIAGAALWHFGILTSTMHNAWIRYTCGRLKSDFRYSAAIVYNNFPWPEAPSTVASAAVEAAAQGVLDARDAFSDSNLADLYDPLTMPPALSLAHRRLDAAVDAAYGRKSFKNDAERVVFLFELHQRYTSLLPASPATKRGRARSLSRRPGAS